MKIGRGSRKSGVYFGLVFFIKGDCRIGRLEILAVFCNKPESFIGFIFCAIPHI